MNMMREIARFIRWHDWAPGKLTLLWSLCLYIAAAYRLPFSSFFFTFLLFLIFASAQSALGFVLNDWGDRELDRRQFKHNAFHGKTPLESTLALALMFLTALLSGLPFLLHPGFPLLWIAWILCAAAYSLSPARLKTRGAAGIAVSFAAQWFLPVLLVFAAFRIAGGYDMWLIAAALTVSGATLELGHQRFDRLRDLRARALTFAASHSEALVDRLYAWALLFDKLSIGVFVWVISGGLAQTPLLGAALLGVYVALFVLSLPTAVRSLAGGAVEDPYYGTQRSLSSLLHQTLLNFVMPLALGVSSLWVSPLYAIALGLFLLWRVVLGKADILWPLRVLWGLRLK